jgi:DNA repair protein RadC
MRENLHEGHRERMRAEYRNSGLPSQPHKQLEMLLYHVRKQVDTNKIAHRLLNRFGSLHDVLNAEISELAKIEGVGRGTAEFLHFIGDIGRVSGEASPVKTGTTLDTPEKTDAFVRERLAGQKSECVLAAYLDAKGRLIHERLARDTAESSSRVENSVRVIAALALQHSAASVLIGHNHPSGCPLPSKKDVAEARRLRDALRSIGTSLCDFIITGEDGEVYSLVRGGLLY